MGEEGAGPPVLLQQQLCPALHIAGVYRRVVEAELVVFTRHVSVVVSEASLGVGAARVLDAVNVIWEVVTQRGFRSVFLPSLLPEKVSVLVLCHPLLPGVVYSHNDHVVDAGFGEKVGEGSPVTKAVN